MQRHYLNKRSNVHGWPGGLQVRTLHIHGNDNHEGSNHADTCVHRVRPDSEWVVRKFG